MTDLAHPAGAVAPTSVGHPSPAPVSHGAEVTPGEETVTALPEKRRGQENPFKAGQVADLPRGRVNYLLEGPPAPAPLVVCIHGLQGSLSAFDRVQPLLWQEGLR